MNLLAEITSWPEAVNSIAFYGMLAVCGFAFCRYVIGDKR